MPANSSSDSSSSIHRFLRRVGLPLLLVLISFLVGIGVQYRHQFKINTDLRSITPHFIADKNLESVVNHLSTSLDKQFSLVLKSNNSEQLEFAEEKIEEWFLEKQPQDFALVDEADQVELFSDLVLKYRFQLLTEDQASDLVETTNQQVLQKANQRLYSLSGTRLYSLSEDPFGYLSDYVLNSISRFGASSANNRATSAESMGAFYQPVFFKITAPAPGFEQQQSMLQQVESLKNFVRSEVIDGEGSIEFLHSGVLFFAAEAAKKARADVTLISTGSSLAILLLMILVFRSLGPLLLPIVSIAIGVGSAFLFCQFTYGAIHIFTIVFGASLIGVVIDYSLHYSYHFGQRVEGADKKKSSQKLYRALSLSLVTSVIGYGALMFSGLDVLKQVAVFSVIGLMVAWFVVLVAGQWLLSAGRKPSDRILRWTISAVLHQLKKLSLRSSLVVVALLVLVSAGTVILKLESKDSPRSFIDPNPDLLQQQAEIEPVLSQFEPATFIVLRGQNSDEVFALSKLLRDFARSNQDSALNDKQLLGADLLLPSFQAQTKNYELNKRLYERGGQAEQFLSAKGMDDAEIKKMLEEYASSNEKLISPNELFFVLDQFFPPLWQEQNDWQYSVILIPRQTEIDRLKVFANQNENVWLIDSIEMSTEAITGLRISAMQLLLVALLLVAVLLFVRYRTLSGVALVLVPTAAIVITLAVFAALGQPILLFHVMALFLVLGLGMDYVIFTYDMTDHPEQTLSAVLLSSITSLFAFGLLSVSQIPVVSAFGATVLIGNIVNTFGSLLVARFRSNELQEI